MLLEPGWRKRLQQTRHQVFARRERSENQELLKELQQVRRRKQPLHIVCREVRVVKKLLLDNSPIAKHEPIAFHLNALSELVAALDQLSELIQWDLRVAEDHLGEDRGVVEEEIQLVEVFQSFPEGFFREVELVSDPEAFVIGKNASLEKA